MDNGQLVTAFLAGSDDAFRQIFDKYNVILYRSARLVCGNDADAEDAVQETFVQAYFHMKELRDPSKLKYWLFRIMYRKVFRITKKHSHEIAVDDIALRADHAAEKSADVTDEICEFQGDPQIEEALAALDEKHRKVIVLYYYSGFSVKEIAAITGSIEGTVKSRLYTARRKIAGMLQNKAAGVSTADTDTGPESAKGSVYTADRIVLSGKVNLSSVNIRRKDLSHD